MTFGSLANYYKENKVIYISSQNDSSVTSLSTGLLYFFSAFQNQKMFSDLLPKLKLTYLVEVKETNSTGTKLLLKQQQLASNN